jgi:hypothetical protein
MSGLSAFYTSVSNSCFKQMYNLLTDREKEMIVCARDRIALAEREGEPLVSPDASQPIS